jgi:hypothetical protein
MRPAAPTPSTSTQRSARRVSGSTTSKSATSVSASSTSVLASNPSLGNTGSPIRSVLAISDLSSSIERLALPISRGWPCPYGTSSAVKLPKGSLVAELTSRLRHPSLLAAAGWRWRAMDRLCYSVRAVRRRRCVPLQATKCLAGTPRSGRQAYGQPAGRRS